MTVHHYIILSIIYLKTYRIGFGLLSRRCRNNKLIIPSVFTASKMLLFVICEGYEPSYEPLVRENAHWPVADIDDWPVWHNVDFREYDSDGNKAKATAHLSPFGFYKYKNQSRKTKSD